MRRLYVALAKFVNHCPAPFKIVKAEADAAYQYLGDLGQLDKPCGARRDRHRLQLREGTSIGGRRKRGAKSQAIGSSRGGQTTKIHAVTDVKGRPYAFVLTPGNFADISVASALVTAMPASNSLIGDMGYDANSLRRLLHSRGTTVVIPSTASRKIPLPFDINAYRQRNVIERMFCRLKDFRRIATRYDKLARNFLSAVSLVAAMLWWID
jgi:transposase